MYLPCNLRWPDICSGDHCSSLSSFSASCRSSLPTAVSWLPVLVIHGIPLCGFPHILAMASTVTPKLARYRWRIHTNCLGYGIFFSPFCSNTEIVYLCSEVSCLYISNATLTDFWETVVFLSCFFCIACWNGHFRGGWNILLPSSNNCTSILNLGNNCALLSAIDGLQRHKSYFIR